MRTRLKEKIFDEKDKEINRLKEEVVNLKIGSKIETEFLYSDTDFSYSNKNKTIEKTSVNTWVGLRCNRILYNSGRYYFSIKIDRTDTNSLIMLGYCSTGNAHSTQNNGFFKLGKSYLFYLHNGQIYENSTPKKTIANYKRPVSGDSFDIVIDFEKKSIYLYCEGNEIGFMSVELLQIFLHLALTFTTNKIK